MSGEFDNVVWEYKLFEKKRLSGGELDYDQHKWNCEFREGVFNELGKQGWEFVGFNTWDAIFKRRKPS